MIIKELSYEERATWSTCPVCKAKHGEVCDPNFGITLGPIVHNKAVDPGVHLGRIQKAPLRVELKPIS